MSPEHELVLKREFALAMLKKPLCKPQDSYDIGTAIFGGDTVSAMRAGSSWPSDPDVLRLKSELLKEFGKEHFLPSRDELARRILDIAEEKVLTGSGEIFRNDAKDREKLLRLYAEVRGYIKNDKKSAANDDKQLPDVIFEKYDDATASS